MAVRSYSGNAKTSAVSGTIAAAVTSIELADATGYPTGNDGPFVIAIDVGLANEEKVLVATRTGNTLTVASGGRGWDGTTAADHAAGAAVMHTFSATDAREANGHINDTTGNPHPQYRLAATAIAATGVTYAGSTDLVATNVEAALDELDAEKISTTAANAAFEAKVSRTGATAGQVPKLQANGTLAFADDAGGISPTIVDAKGDLVGATADNTPARVPIGVDGQVLTADAAAALGVKWATPGAGPKLVFKTADESVASSATPQDDDQLLFPVAANEKWVFTLYLLVGCGSAATGDFRAAITVPAGVVLAWSFVNGTYFNGDPRASDSAADAVNLEVVTASGTSLIVAGSVPDIGYQIKGYVTVGATAGDVRLQWAQASSNATATTVRAGSHLIANKVA